MPPPGRADVVVIGSGVAGLSAALSAAEGREGSSPEVVLLEKAPAREAGGNTRWTDAYFRLADVYEPAPGFVEDMVGFSRGGTDRRYAETLVERLPEAMEWIQSHGLRFHRRATYFVTASRPRMMPTGGGESLLRHLTRACEDARVPLCYDTPVVGLEWSEGGYLVSYSEGGRTSTLTARVCIVACGGFEGDPDRLRRHLGAEGAGMKPIAPGGRYNTGEVIDQVLALGAGTAGEWSNFHGEPVDSRSTQAEASVMVFPYGILLNGAGDRFLDEGLGTVDETYEDCARAILAQPGATASLVADASFLQVPGIDRGLLTDRSPMRADTLAGLAEQLGLEARKLERTVRAYNDAVTDGPFDPSNPDGKATVGLNPPKSNWATRIETPPYVAIPLVTDIVFTYGGLRTDEHARVLTSDGNPLPGLYAAGECTGIYHHKYPGATSVMRGLVFGRTAGLEAARQLGGTHG